MHPPPSSSLRISWISNLDIYGLLTSVSRRQGHEIVRGPVLGADRPLEFVDERVHLLVKPAAATRSWSVNCSPGWVAKGASGTADEAALVAGFEPQRIVRWVLARLGRPRHLRALDGSGAGFDDLEPVPV
jgi:hypothetical protein